MRQKLLAKGESIILQPLAIFYHWHSNRFVVAKLSKLKQEKKCLYSS